MITIHDVAKLAGVSISTVSNVLNNRDRVAKNTAERVEHAIEELHYFPNTHAKSLKLNSSRIIGVIVEDLSVFTSGDIVNGITEYCDQNDYTINLANLHIKHKIGGADDVSYHLLEDTQDFKRSISRNLNSLLTSRICALIYIGIYPRDVSSILPQLDIPLVYIYAYAKDNYCVNYDDIQGARLAIEHLASAGHEKIGLVCGARNSIPSGKRIDGYRSVLKEHGLSIHDEYIKIANWKYEDAYMKAMELLRLPTRPTAIFAMSDIMAYGVLDACDTLGISVPAEVSVHGFDNLMHSEYTHPPLTTVALPLEHMGEMAAKTLIQIMNDEPPEDQNVLVPCSHVLRSTTSSIQ